MATKRGDRLAEILKEMEALVKRLRADLRRAARDSGLTKNLERAAEALRKQAVAVAAQVEKYAHDIRVELTKASKAKPAKAMRKAAKSVRRKVAAKKRAVAGAH